MKSMKVIFLDIDGVLNSEDLANRRIKEKRNQFEDGKDTFIDEIAVKLLTDFCEQYNVKLVISSSWRHWDLNGTLQDFSRPKYEILHPIIPYIVGITPRIYIENNDGSYDSVDRGIEIKKYLDAHDDIEEYCILDDDNDMLPEQMNSFVQTTFWHGLTEIHIPLIKKILKV